MPLKLHRLDISPDNIRAGDSNVGVVAVERMAELIFAAGSKELVGCAETESLEGAAGVPGLHNNRLWTHGHTGENLRGLRQKDILCSCQIGEKSSTILFPLPTIDKVGSKVMLMDRKTAGFLKSVIDQPHIIGDFGLDRFQKDDLFFINGFLPMCIIEGRQILTVCDILAVSVINLSDWIPVKSKLNLSVAKPVGRANDFGFMPDISGRIVETAGL